MPFYRLCRDTFVRTIGDYGYITSQLTKHDRLYDGPGENFLASLTRKPQEFENVLAQVLACFEDPPLEELTADLKAFLADLESDQFIVSGSSSTEIDAREPRFSYTSANPKTAVYNFLQNREDLKYPDTGEFLHTLLRKQPRIIGCQIELVNRCNERCIHCYIPHENKRDLLDTSVVLDVLRQLNAMGTISLSLSGGEPFIHPDILRILSSAKELDFSIAILSNLTLLTKNDIDILREINPSLVQTSLYSMSAQEHDRITCLPGSQKKTLAALEDLIEADIPIQISCPVMKTNRHSYKEVVQWAQAHRCKAQTDFIMMARTDFSTCNLKERLSLDETRQLIQDVLTVDIDYDSLLSTPHNQSNPDEEKNKPVCGVGIDNICLAANGTYYPCSGWQGYPVGNARTERLADVWSHSPALARLREVTKGSFPACLSCVDREFCAMCLVRNFNESGGDMFCINRHFCDAARINRELVEAHKAKLLADRK